MRLGAWFCWALALLCETAAASPRALFDHKDGVRIYSSNDGLPQAGVKAILQTRDGYLWVGTFDGLARFDGTTFTVFRDRPGMEGGRGAAPASDRIVSLFEDGEERLWVGTENAGLSVRDHSRFRHLPACGRNCQVNAMTQGPDGAIWAATSVGLLKLDGATGEERWKADVNASGVNAVAVGGAGQVFAGGPDGFHVVEGSQLRAIPLPEGSHGVRLLKRDGDGLLVGTDRELYRYLPGTNTWKAWGIAEPIDAVRDASGLWWVSQAPGRVLRQDTSGTWSEVAGLSTQGAAYLAWDSEGDLWASHGINGLARMRPSLFGLVSQRQLGTNMAGRAVTSDGHDGLWLGSACGGLFHWSSEGQARQIPVQDTLRSSCIFSLLLDRHGALWIGTAEGTLGRWADGRLQLVEAWPRKEPLNLWQLEDGTYLVSAGLSAFAFTADDQGHITRRWQPDALQGMRISSVVKARNGGYWIAGDQGVLRLQGERVLERWTPEQGLSSRFARAVLETPDGELWIGTYGGGLDRISNGVLRHYGRKNGLFDDTVSCIQPDTRGRLWLAGNLGVSLLPAPAQAGGSIASVRFAERDGLIPAEINGGGSTPCHQDAEGRLWFSLVAGFGVLDPTRTTGASLAQPVPHIEYVAVNGRALDPSRPELVLAPFSRNLEIRYTAVNLARPEETLFRFRLAGVDRDWIEAGQGRSIIYPTIPWGTHPFELQASIAGGPWESSTAVLTIVHPEPWYQRPWIWMLVTLLGLTVLVVSGHENEDDAAPGETT
jgi:ligand-binding sensor domain-containing protein